MTQLVAKTIKLNNNQHIPTLGLGTWRMDTREEVARALTTAIDKLGYVHIDCAQQYKNEELIGDVLKNELKHIKREQLFITTKVWNSNHSPEHVRKACELSMKNLGVDYLDLYLVHWPVAFKFTSIDCEPLFHKDENGRAVLDTNTSLQSTWQAMETLVDEGLVKSIGVSNYSLASLYDLLAYARIKPVVNQVEAHPFFTRSNFIRVCHDLLNIRVVAYRPLAYGPRGELLQNEQVTGIAQRLNKTPAQIIIRWSLQNGLVVIPKATSEKHLRENMEAFDFDLTEQDMNALSSLNRNLRMCNPDWGLYIFE